MLSRKFKSLTFLVALSSLVLSPLASVSAQTEPVADDSKDETPAKKAEEKKEAAVDLEVMRDRRQLLRNKLMVPSLVGIRGISYGIPGHNPFTNLDKVVSTRLKQLPIPVHKITELKSGGTKPVDAILQLKVLAAGGNTTLVELTVTQWSRLCRNPDIQSRTITYTDQAVTHNTTVDDVAGKMVNQFVLDYLKANNVGKKGKTKKG